MVTFARSRFRLLRDELGAVASEELAEVLAAWDAGALTEAQAEKLRAYLDDEVRWGGILSSGVKLEGGFAASTAYGIERQARRLAEVLA